MDLRGSDRVAGVCAVIVTHNPALPRLEASLLAVRRQVDWALIVDNCSIAPVGEWLAAQSAAGAVEVLRMDANVGIAAALNRGIAWAKLRGFANVLLLDHDSVPALDMVERLVRARQELERQGIRVAAVGPEFRDDKYPGISPFYQFEGWRIVRKSCAGQAAGATVPAECLITSGSLISMETLGSVGLMETDLFVDYVDIEWGLRAGSLGYKCFGVCGAVMDHQLGDSIRPFLGIAVPVRSPLRHYYLFRNACLLYRRGYVPLRWKLNDAYRLLLKYGFYSLMTPPRLQHFRMMTLGIAHALMNRAGKLG